MKKMIILIGMLVIVTPATSMAESYAEMVAHYLSILNKPKGPSIDDSIYLEGIESELSMEQLLCKEKGWIPPYTSKECGAFIKARSKNGCNTASINLSWVKTKIPHDHVFEVDLIEKVDWGVKIHVSIQGTQLVFLRVADPTLFIPLGWLALGEVNGTKVGDLLEQDIASGVKLSSFVETW